MSPEQLWELCLDGARDDLDPLSFQSWLEKSSFRELDGTRMVIEFPNEFTASHAKARFGEMLQACLSRISGRNDLSLVFYGPPAEPTMTPARSRDRVRQKVQGGDYLRPGYTFERFVVGPNNQLAYSGAVAVTADSGQVKYNPLFIYGGVGLGKTHLIQAIAHKVKESGRGRTFRYLSAELFLQQYVTALERQEIPLFRNRYLNVDYLLMDDIQFLKGKERTQEEFFHRFNEFYQNGKQIVITADRPPHELEDIEERLVSRFQSGLIADIKPPEYETRLAILHLLVKDESVEVPDEVLDYIASSIRKNVRQLAGVIHRLAAASRFTGCSIDMDMAQGEISSSLGASSRALTPGSITSRVAEAFDVTPGQIRGKERKRSVLIPRQVAMSLIREMTSLSLKEIGAFFSGRDHSTVLNSIERIEKLSSEDPALARRIEDVGRSLSSL